MLKEGERWAAAVYVAEQDLYRVTLTAPLINQAAVVAFLVAGGAKAGVLREVLHGPRDRRACRPNSSSRTTGSFYG